jgi:hypothetical protein
MFTGIQMDAATLTEAPERDAAPALRAFPDGKLLWHKTELYKQAGISRSQGYELEAAGLGPRVVDGFGRRPMVTAAAAEAWIARLEAHGDEMRRQLKAWREQRGRQKGTR